VSAVASPSAWCAFEPGANASLKRARSFWKSLVVDTPA
jgi:hypothetical protein